MTGQQNAPRVESNGASQDPTEGQPQNNGWCLCARDGDRWLCQGPAHLDRPHPEGRCCSLDGIDSLAGTDNWDRPEARQALAENPCEVTRG